MNTNTATAARPNIRQWMGENYTAFFKFALIHLPKWVGNNQDREDAVSDLILKMVRTASFEKRLAEGKDLSFSVLLHFVMQMHSQSLDHAGRDMLGRSHGCRTRKELDTGEEFPFLLSDWGAEAVPLPKDQDADPDKQGQSIEFVDHSPTAEDQYLVDELWAIIEAGMEREWSGEALARRMRVLKLQSEGGTQGDIQREFGVGPTRAKTFKKEIREVVSHAIRPRKALRLAQKVVPERRFREEPLTSTFKKPAKAQVDGSDVPQFDRLEDLYSILRAWETKPDLSERQFGYALHALRAMGLTDKKGNFSNVGKAVMKVVDLTSFQKAMTVVFECSEVGKAWLEWSNAVNPKGRTPVFHDLDPSTSLEFLEARSSLSKSTAKRRSRTLRYWATFLQSPLFN